MQEAKEGREEGGIREGGGGKDRVKIGQRR